MRLPVPSAGRPNRPGPDFCITAYRRHRNIRGTVISLDMPAAPDRHSAYHGLGVESFPAGSCPSPAGRGRQQVRSELADVRGGIPAAET